MTRITAASLWITLGFASVIGPPAAAEEQAEELTALAQGAFEASWLGGMSLPPGGGLRAPSVAPRVGPAGSSERLPGDRDILFSKAREAVALCLAGMTEPPSSCRASPSSPTERSP